ncbi:MAG: hypothetical protein IJD91_09020 [Clostridia bacterium]|nr:hypothetical protein [Clostridia bacterium]
MYGAIAALIISLMMIALVIYKGNATKHETICCRKSEFYSLSGHIPDDCIIEVWIGRNTYDKSPIGKAYGRNLRNNISE